MKKSKSIPIVFDMDIAGDCSNVGALATMHRLCDNGEARLLAVTACYDAPFIGGCVDGINAYYGHTVPVGILHGAPATERVVFAEQLCREYPGRYPMGAAVPDAVEVVRRALAAEEDGSVTFLVVGCLATAAALLDSMPDDASPLCGRDLAAVKIARTVVMGGRFPTFGDPTPAEFNSMAAFGDPTPAEFNIRANIRAAQHFTREWPGDAIFSGFEIGWRILTLGDFTLHGPRDNPARRAYELLGTTEKGRYSCDLTAALEAVRPGAYFDLHEAGRITVDDEGHTFWMPEEGGRQTYLLPKTPLDDIAALLNALVWPGEGK